MTNSDTTPLRFVTDGRLLTLDVTPGDGDPEDGPRPAARKKGPRAAVHCALPSDIRPSSDADNVHVLAPDATYVEEFDPRLYCFDAREAAALVPGARVVAHLGWAAGRGAARTPPFVADESFGADSRSGVEEELTAEAVVTPEPLAIPEPEGGAPHKLVVTAPARIDAARGRDLLIDVAVENVTSRPIRLMLRPETLAFEVASPRGVHQCAWQRLSRRANRGGLHRGPAAQQGVDQRAPGVGMPGADVPRARPLHGLRAARHAPRVPGGPSGSRRSTVSRRRAPRRWCACAFRRES